MMKLLIRLSLLKKCLIINTMIFKLNFYNEPNVQNYTQEIKETLICIISVIYLNIYLYIATTLFLVQPLWPLWIEHNSSQLTIISVSKVKHLFLIFIFTLFYFTILYWFCHTLTWVHHGCTCDSKHEPPSHLPPHNIPLGHPRAPAPSMLYPASDIAWWFDSYMIVYMG